MSDTEYRIDFKRLRLASGKTQTETAEALGVAQNTISTWERGSQPHVRYLPLMARMFDCSIEELYGLPRP